MLADVSCLQLGGDGKPAGTPRTIVMDMTNIISLPEPEAKACL
jgi:hypothetical protein